MSLIKGYATIVDPDLPRAIEYDTKQCGHCMKVLFVKAGSGGTVYLIPTGRPGHFREEMGAFCRVCMRPVCLPCDDHGQCVPFERFLEAAEARDRLRRAVGV